MDQTFSDGLGSVTIVGNTVRLDFVTLSPVAKDPKGQPQLVFSHRVVMDLDAFVRTAGKVQESMQTLAKLAQNARDKAAAAGEKKPETPAEAPAAKPASPKSSGKKPFP